MGRVTHFEFNVQNPQRAAEFYQRVFGWTIEKWQGPLDYWLVMTGDEVEPGIDGGIGPTGGAVGSNIVIDVTSVDEVTEQVLAAGGTIVSPRTAVPGVGWTAYYQGPEGIVFGVMESDPSAK
jgi:predicted enzyme related to lactoylglutathione lyase